MASESTNTAPNGDLSEITDAQREHLNSDYHKNVCIPKLQQNIDNTTVQVDENDTLDTSGYNSANGSPAIRKHIQIIPDNNESTDNVVKQPSNGTPTHKHSHSTPNHRSSRVNSITSYCTSPIHRNKCTEPLCCVHSTQAEYMGYHWYFAIGSMCNPTSLKLRGITPVESYVAILHGWRIVFDGVAGMANVMEDPNASFHGVLHRITHDEMIVLDKIEGSYNRLPVDVQLYDGRIQRATVYKMDETKLDRSKPAGLPSERYIDIITQGLQHFNGDPKYIEWLKAQPCVPRKKSTEYSKLQVPCRDCKKYTLEELSKYDGKDGRDMMIAVNGKVLRWVGDLSNPSARMQYEYTAQRYAGTDVTFKWSRMLYEPKYKIATCYNDMEDDHKRWVEDMFAERFQANDQPNYECVGLLADTYNIDTDYINKQNNKENGNTEQKQHHVDSTQQTVHTLSGDMTITQRSISQNNKL